MIPFLAFTAATITAAITVAAIIQGPAQGPFEFEETD